MNGDTSNQKIAFTDGSFPVYAAGDRRVSPDGPLDIEVPYWHEELEIKYIREGRVSLVLEGEPVEAERGDIVVISPFESHYMRVKLTDVRYDILILNVRYFLSAASQLPREDPLWRLAEGELKLRHIVRDNAKVEGLLAMLFDELRPGEALNRAAVSGLLIYFLNCLVGGERAGAPTEGAGGLVKSRKRLEPAIRHIKERYMDSCDEKALAKMCGLEKCYFSRLFKKAVGVNVRTYLSQTRLYAAETLLRATDKKAADIAAEIGLGDGEYFYRWFKRQTGKTPSGYRAPKGE